MAGITLNSEKLKRFLPIGIAVGAGLLAVAAAQRYIQDQLAMQRSALEREKQRIMAEYPQPIEVVVAGKDIPQGTALTPDLLAMGEVPEKFMQPYAVRDAREAVGQITIAPLSQGEQVLSNKIRREQDLPLASTLSSVVPKGRRAVTIEVDTLTGVGGFVRPGDIVDVVWTLAVPVQGQQQPEIVTMTLFQDVPVMAVARDLHPPRQAAPAAPSEEAVSEADAGMPPVPEEIVRYTVTLALPPQEIAFLLFAREQGRVQLSLRSKQDDAPSTAVAPVNMNAMMGAMLGNSMTQAPVPISREIELYKGLERNVIVLSDQPTEAPPASQ